MINSCVRSRILSLLALFALCLAAPTRARADDERVYRKLTLDNGLRVVLASDPTVNVSAASMGVGVGANADPRDAQGLAHFLEHMLFLANEKYPELNSYSNFLQTHGGASNAYTGQDTTNYHFQVSHDALPEALDRFAQFFISPTLDYSYAKREMMAVNSEHQKNTMDDTWRVMQLQRMQLRPEHPASGFSTGNAETLANAKEEQLRGFFESYYKPSNMALAVLSNRSLDDLEHLVRERFAAIPSGEPKPWTLSADILEEAQGLRLLKVVPVKDLRQLQVFFEVPPQHANALTKIDQMVGMTMGDEGAGSLLSYLKQRGLANSLSAGVGGTRFYSSCNVTIGLTEGGLKQWREVLRLTFAYTHMLRTSGFPRTLWEEARTLAQLSDKYGAKPEGTGAVIELANNVLDYGLEVADQVNVTFQDPDPAAYQALVDALAPQNCVVFLVAKGQETDKTEQYYGTQYSVTLEQGEAFDSLKDVEVPKELHLPLPNPFVPKDTQVLAEQPVLIQDDDAVTLYYAQDAEFHRPKVSIQLNVLSPAVTHTPKSAALTGLYTAVLQEQLNEFAYPALMAGLDYSLSASDKGLWISVSGYSDSVFSLLTRLAKALRGDLDAETFTRVQQRTIEELKNFPLGQAYQVVTDLSRELNNKQHVMPSERLPEVQAATLESLQAYVKELLAHTHIQAVCAGNLTAARARAAVAEVQQAIGSEPFDAAKAYQPAYLFLGEGDEIVLSCEGQTDQACLRLDYQVGKSDVNTRVATQLIARAVGNPFFTEMRTRQKLGYIVFSGAFNREDVQCLVFLIQSGTNTPADMRARAEAFIDKLPELFKQLPDEVFEAIRASLIEDREKKPKSIAEKAGLFFGSAFDKEGDFEWIDKEIAALKNLKREDVAKLLQETVAPETRRRVVYELAAKGQEVPAGTVTDLAGFSKGRTYLSEKAGR